MSLGAAEPQSRERESIGFGRSVEAFVLLLLASGRSYGYEIRSRLEDLGYTRAMSDPGALYRLLRELEASGAIRSEWDVSGRGPARRYYLLTEAGFDQLDRGAERLAAMRNRVELFFAGYKALGRERKRELVAAGAVKA